MTCAYYYCYYYHQNNGSSYCRPSPLLCLFSSIVMTVAVVDVACVDSGKSFSGDLEKAESVPLRFLSFVSMMRSHLKGEKHWGSGLEGVDLYLAQCPIFQRQQEGSSGGGGGGGGGGGDHGQALPLSPLREYVEV